MTNLSRFSASQLTNTYIDNKIIAIFLKYEYNFFLIPWRFVDTVAIDFLTFWTLLNEHDHQIQVFDEGFQNITKHVRLPQKIY